MYIYANKNPKATAAPDHINTSSRTGDSYMLKNDKISDFFNPGPREKENGKERTIQR